MPTLFKMSNDKQSIDSPTVVIAETSSASPRKTKKYVIIAVSSILAAAIILAAILVGMYIFTEAQKEILKYSMTLNNNAKQDVTSDPNENVVQYHVSSPGQETWIVNDFNKDIQVVKIQKGDATNCYINPLNRTTAMDPSKVAKPQSMDIKGSSSLIYITSGTPISDTSFLGKTASSMCKGVSVYWVYPQCVDKNNANADGSDVLSRSKRDVDGSPFYYAYSQDNSTVCVVGCCAYVCACEIDYFYYYDGNYIYCAWFTYDCNGNSTKPEEYGCYNGPRGLTCPNKDPAVWPYC